MKLFLTLLFFYPLFLLSQPTNTGNWFIFFGNTPLNDRWNVHYEAQYRNYNFAGDLEQLLLRTGIGYNLTENNNNLLLGYGYIHSEPYVSGTDEKIKTNEHRIFQQFITRQKFGRIYLQHRYRVEERFLAEDTQMRFRYFLAVNLPLNKVAMDPQAFYLSVYNELFIRPEAPVFDRNRLYAGLGYVFHPNTRMEAGWMRQMYEGGHRHQWQLIVFNTLRFDREE